MDNGDIILYMSLVAGIVTLILLFSKGSERYIKQMIRIFTALLLIDFLLLTYYFIVTELTINYVWAYTSKDLPLFYKLSGVLAGQQGTLLFWALLISIGSLWLNERYRTDASIKKMQIVVILIGIYFIFLTMLDSPFKTIYQLYPDISEDFVPLQGNGLKPILINPWMAVHPPIMFIAYAAMTIPFAAAVVYLKDMHDRDVHKLWIQTAVKWCRISWLFLTLGIAIGGIWAFESWGRMWGWDPVETSSLVPWLLLTGALHTLSEHRRNRAQYRILAPTLVAISFVLVVFATLVTRSGFFESIHAFGSGKVATYLVLLIVICVIALIYLAIARLNRESKEEDGDSSDEEVSFITRANLFYLTILLFTVLTFISFWGIMFPALNKLLIGTKIGIGISFYNLWSYPFFITLMLLAGLGLRYRTSKKSELLKEFSLFFILTVIAGLLRPTDAWNIVDYSAIINPDKPVLYSLIGSISALSFIPPSVYMIYGIIERGKMGIIASKNRDYKIKEAGVLMIHFGVVLITIGAVFSTMFSEELNITLDRNDKGIVVPVEGTSYSVKLIDSGEYPVYGDDYEYLNLPVRGESITEFYTSLESGVYKDSYTVYGFVEDIKSAGGYTYAKLVDGDRTLWIATDVPHIKKYDTIVTTGFLMSNFSSASLNMTFDWILFTGDVEPIQKAQKARRQVISNTQQVEVVVYDREDTIGQGVARYIYYGTADDSFGRVMIDRGIFYDVQVDFRGFQQGGRYVPLTIRIVPLIGYLWLGVILLAAGIIAILLFDRRSD